MTLAKSATRIVKNAERKFESNPAELAQIHNLSNMDQNMLSAVLAATVVAKTWGMGAMSQRRSNKVDTHSVLDLSHMDLATIRRRWTIGICSPHVHIDIAWP